MSAVAVRDAATVMLVRDGADGDGPLEVFMLRRSLQSVFVGGAYVFPGGAVDEADRHAEVEAWCSGRSDDQASAVLGVASGALAFWVAAIRECFEEAGVLLATGPGGELVSFAATDVAARFVAHRAGVYRGDLRLLRLCELEGLRLAADRIRYFGHWITPEGQPRRYDTRFFVAAAPTEQVPLHDDHETVAHMWVRPADALAQLERGEIQMIRPTSMSLEAIGRFDRSADLLAAAAEVEVAPHNVPRIGTAHGVRIPLPGDQGVTMYS